MEDKEIIDRVELGNKMLFTYDNWLLKHNLSEKCITHKLAEYLQQIFTDYNVDCEYNGNIENDNELKKIWIVKHELEKKGLLKEKEMEDVDKEFAIRRVFPDIIIHKRGSNEYNLCIIEVKKSNSTVSFDYDEIKLKAYTRGNFGNNLKYQLGIFIKLIIEKEKIDFEMVFYKDGEKNV